MNHFAKSSRGHSLSEKMDSGPQTDAALVVKAISPKELLKKEKEFTRQRDAVSAERRELPWVKVDKPYGFDAPDGKKSLADLFAGRSQLIVQHFMLGPGWKEGCVGCSFKGDHVDGALLHLE